MNILVMDDESLALKRVERFLKALGYTCTCVDSLESFEQAMAQKSYELFILDIHMPSLSGIDVAKKVLQDTPNAFIIFQTAYEAYALKAFEIGAIDYLLKPFSQETLQKSIERARSYQKEHHSSFMTRNKEESYLIGEKEIIYIEADLNEVMLRTKEHFSYLDRPISFMEKMLSPTHFFRIHRSLIICIDAIKSIRTVEQSKLEFSFKEIDDVICSSKEGAKKFRETYTIASFKMTK